MKPITKKDLKIWLKSKPKGTIVGTSGVHNCCPVATFYKETYSQQLFICSTYRYSPNDNETIYNKFWLRNFITNIDELHQYLGPVTAEQALKALNKPTGQQP